MKTFLIVSDISRASSQPQSVPSVWACYLRTYLPGFQSLRNSKEEEDEDIEMNLGFMTVAWSRHRSQRFFCWHTNGSLVPLKAVQGSQESLEFATLNGCTLHKTSISHLGKRKIIFKIAFSVGHHDTGQDCLKDPPN